VNYKIRESALVQTRVCQFSNLIMSIKNKRKDDPDGGYADSWVLISGN
jgi:hypothetical protein